MDDFFSLYWTMPQPPHYCELQKWLWILRVLEKQKTCFSRKTFLFLLPFGRRCHTDQVTCIDAMKFVRNFRSIFTANSDIAYFHRLLSMCRCQTECESESEKYPTIPTVTPVEPACLNLTLTTCQTLRLISILFTFSRMSVSPPTQRVYQVQFAQLNRREEWRRVADWFWKVIFLIGERNGSRVRHCD